MKKFFALLAVVLAVVSCQKDVDVDVNMGGDLATISVVLPEDAITRANWNGNDSAQGGLANTSGEVVRVIMHIYDDQGRVSDKRYVDYLAEGETTVAFDVRLVPNRQYTFVAWADMVDGEADVDKYFETEDLRAVTMIAGSWDAMNEERDAFTATYTTPKDKPYTSSSNISLTLTRPFAKLRVVTTDMEFLNDLDVQPKTAKVSYATKHYNAFNAVAGVAINKENTGVEHEYTIASYGEDWRNGADMTLFTDYFFAADGQEEVNFSLEVFDQNNKLIKYNNFNTAIPVKRNNLTTIAGNILTEGNNITVTVDPVFAGKQKWPSEEAEELAAAAMFGGEVTLTEDIVLNQPLDVKSNMTLNLGGKTLEGVINVNEDAKLTVNNGTIVNKDKSKSGITSNGDLTLNDVNIESARHGVRVESGKVVINGGEYKVAPISNSTLHALNIGDDGTTAEVVIKGGTFIGPQGTMADSGSAVNVRNGSSVVIEGGNFSGGKTKTLSANQNATLTVKGGTFDQDPSNYCTAGYYALQYEAGKYTVQAFDAAARTLTINSKDEFLKLSILDAKWNEFFSNGQGTDITDFWIQNGGKGADFYYKWDWTIKLNTDIDFENATLNAPISLTKFGCFDGQNHTIKNVNIQDGLFVASSTKLQNIKLDNIDVTAGYDGNSTAGILASDCNAGIDNITIANSSVEGGKYTGGVVGYGYTYVTNCTLTNCVVKGGYKCGGVIGYICANSGANVTGNTLTNCTVVAAPQHADNKTEYVLGMVVGNYNCNGTCADNVVYDITTTATKVIGKIEAGKVVDEYNNTVTYVVENYNELKTAIINGGIIEFANDITVDEWVMFSEDYTVSDNSLIHVDEIDVTIDGKGHTLTVNAIESGGNGGSLFQGASVLNISNLTIKCGDSVTTGGLGMVSGVIKNVHFVGGGYAIRPADGKIKVENCTFATKMHAIYFEEERDNLTVTDCTFNKATYAIILRGDVKFTDNIINNGNVTVRSGSPVVTGNNFNNVRLKVYADATATFSNNIINVLEFEKTTYASTFTDNTLSAEAQAALDAATKVN